MCGQVIEDDDGAGGNLWDKNFADVSGKGRAVHRTLDGCDQRIPRQPCDQRLRAPGTARPSSALRRVRFVFTAVSSMKTTRSGKAAMAGSDA